MARIPRQELIDETEVGMYHCVNRCVRRAFLCGEDPFSGKNFDHRKGWIRQRLEFLAGQFGIDVCGFAVMSNHVHVVLRNRPDVVAAWSDQEVARRWWNVFPSRREEDGSPAKPRAHELEMLTADSKALEERRQRLSSLSWFMRCLCETVARRANKEDECTGRFWEGRYKCQRLLDEAAILACSVYVDLNPIRAGVAKTPESSRFTAAYDRIQARKGGAKGRSPAGKGAAPKSGATPVGQTDGWLSPVELRERQDAKSSAKSRRASNKGFLPVKLTEYLRLLDWTGRQARKGKRGRIPPDLAPILERLHVASDHWVETVLHFGRWFRRAAGRAVSLAAEAERHDRHWLHGIKPSRKAFA